MSACGSRVDATDGAARATTITTPRGTIRTPCFMPVGTRGTVRAADAADLEALGAQVVLANTYHLMLRPGRRRRGRASAGCTASPAGTATCSPTPAASRCSASTDGSPRQHRNVKLDDDGVTFRSTYDGSTHRLTPELAVPIQEQLGADIQMQLDVCPPLPSPEPARAPSAVERTLRWGERALAARRRTDDQALFGIVQGGIDVDLRVEAAGRGGTAPRLGFDGYGIGGLSVGESRAEMVPAIAATVGHLPADRPRYVMGLGDPAGMVEAVALASTCSTACCRPASPATARSSPTAGRLNLRNARCASDDGPLDEGCACRVCAR